jgi:hypothetical protein
LLVLSFGRLHGLPSGGNGLNEPDALFRHPRDVSSILLVIGGSRIRFLESKVAQIIDCGL